MLFIHIKIIEYLKSSGLGKNKHSPKGCQNFDILKIYLVSVNIVPHKILRS